MASNMESAVKQSFPEAKLVTDRFHVVRLASEALQHLRVKHRWEELDKENEAIETAKKQGKRYKPIVFENGDTAKQLLTRCRYIIAKKPDEWTPNQQARAKLLFEHYPGIETAYKHVLEFRSIYEFTNQEQAQQSFIRWIDKTDKLKIKEFNTVANMVKHNMVNILNFFIHRHTNANAESFNSKVKLFRANQRGVVDTQFFLFRLTKLFA